MNKSEEPTTPKTLTKPEPESKAASDDPTPSEKPEQQEALPTAPAVLSPGGQAVAPRREPTMVELRTRFGNLEAKPPSRNTNLKMLVYGDAGTGKTTFFGSAQKVPSMRDLLVLDIEGGSMSLADDQTIDTIQIHSYEKFARMADFLRLYAKARVRKDRKRMVLLEQAIKPNADPEEIAKNPKIYRSVLIDSLSEAQKLCMYHLLGINVATHALDLEPDSPEFKQWGAAAEMVRLLVRTYRSLPYNVFFVCALGSQEDDKKRIHSQPALPGKLAKEIHGFVDVVGFMASKERAVENETVTERRIYLAPGERFQAKDRYHIGNNVRYLINATLQDFLDAGKEDA